MAKKRTTSKQKAASRRNLEKARAARRKAKGFRSTGYMAGFSASADRNVRKKLGLMLRGSRHGYQVFHDSGDLIARRARKLFIKTKRRVSTSLTKRGKKSKWANFFKDN